MRKGQTSGQINLLTGKIEVDLSVRVKFVERKEKDGRDAVTVVSKEYENRYAVFVLVGWDKKRPRLRVSSDSLTYGERRQAYGIVCQIFIDERER